MIAIPFDPSISSDQEITFSGAEAPITLRFTWNAFSEKWFVKFGEIEPRRLIMNFPILRSTRYLLPFKGDFMMKRVATTVQNVIDYDDLGKNWFLCYLTADEVEEWGVRNGME